jgi:RimJ/RimL family protein N-acetyltransferase
MRHIEAPTLKTDRLALRGFVDDDVDGLVDTLMSDPEVMATLPQQPETPEEQHRVARDEYLELYRGSWPDSGWGGWAVCVRSADVGEPGALVGFAGFEPPKIDGAGPELGYCIGRRDWGKGLMGEAACAAAGGIENGAPELRAHYHPNYYAAFVLDPDGYNIEAVCHAT